MSTFKSVKNTRTGKQFYYIDGTKVSHGKYHSKYTLCKIQNWRDERHVIYQHLKQKGHDYEKRKKFFDDEIDRLTNLQNFSSNKKFYEKFLKEIESVEF